MTVFGMSPALPLAILGVVIMAATMIVEKGIEAKHGAALIPQSFIRTRQFAMAFTLPALSSPFSVPLSSSHSLGSWLLPVKAA